MHDKYVLYYQGWFLTLCFLFLTGYLYAENVALVKEVNNINNINARLTRLAGEKEEIKSEAAKLEEELKLKNEAIEEAGSKARAETLVLAVVDGEGVAIPMEVEIRRGEGRVLLDINGTVYAWDTQLAIDKIVRATAKALEADLGDKDVIFHIRNPYQRVLAIDGSSAGPAMAVALAAALEDRRIREGVLVTGDLRADGSIKSVGGIRLKVEAAKKAGAHTILVPVGNDAAVDGIRIMEVSDIREVLEFMIEP